MLQHVATAWKTWSCCCARCRHFGPSTLFSTCFLLQLYKSTGSLSLCHRKENSKKENIRPVLLESLQITGKKKAYTHNSRTCLRQQNPIDMCFLLSSTVCSVEGWQNTCVGAETSSEQCCLYFFLCGSYILITNFHMAQWIEPCALNSESRPLKKLA